MWISITWLFSLCWCCVTFQTFFSTHKGDVCKHIHSWVSAEVALDQISARPWRSNRFQQAQSSSRLTHKQQVFTPGQRHSLRKHEIQCLLVNMRNSTERWWLKDLKLFLSDRGLQFWYTRNYDFICCRGMCFSGGKSLCLRPCYKAQSDKEKWGEGKVHGTPQAKSVYSSVSLLSHRTCV